MILLLKWLLIGLVTSAIFLYGIGRLGLSVVLPMTMPIAISEALFWYTIKGYIKQCLVDYRCPQHPEPPTSSPRPPYPEPPPSSPYSVIKSRERGYGSLSISRKTPKQSLRDDIILSPPFSPMDTSATRDFRRWF